MQISNFKTYNDQFIAIDHNGRFYLEGSTPTSNGNILIDNLSHDFVMFPQNNDQLELVGENTNYKLNPFSLNVDSRFVENDILKTISVVPYSIYFATGNTFRNRKLNAEIIPFTGNALLYVDIVLLVTVKLNDNTVIELPIIFDNLRGTFQIAPFRESGSVLIQDLSDYFNEQEKQRIRFQMHIQNNRINIKGINNEFLTCTGDQIVGNSVKSFEYEAFGIYRALKPFSDIIYNKDAVYLKANNNRYWEVENISGELKVVTTNIVPNTMFIIEYLNNNTEPLSHGMAVRFSLINLSGMFGGSTSKRTNYLYLKSNGQIGVTQEGNLAACVFQIDYYKLLRLAYNGERADNFSFSSIRGADVLSSGYEFVRDQAYISIGPRTGMSPLKSYRLSNIGRESRANTATNFGYDKLMENRPISSTNFFHNLLRNSPNFITIEGYVHNHPIEGGIPLRNYYNRDRQDWMITALPLDEASCASAQYTYSHLEGFANSKEYLNKKEVISNLHRDGKIHRIKVYTDTWESLTSFTIRPIWLPSGHTTGSKDPRQPRRALVLSGGGAKGCFEVGAIKKLWDDGYRPDIICGVSVGSINAVKLAEMRDESANDLIGLWRVLTNERNRVYYNGHYLKIFEKLLQKIGGAGVDTLISAGIGSFLFNLGGPLGSVFGTTAGALIGNELSNLDEKTIRLFNYAVTLLNSMHSMEPLRNRLRENIDPARLLEASNRVKLRLGITDLKTGQFYTVTGPNSSWGSENAMIGMVENEPDHQLGHNWLTYPIYGTEGYTMDIADAVYASSALPAFMEPQQFKFNQTFIQKIGNSNYSRLVASLPDGLEELLEITRAISTSNGGLSDADESRITEIINRSYGHGENHSKALQKYGKDGIRGYESTKVLAFDGGLRDVLPIRTAMRLGATEIICITGDKMHNFNYGYSAPTRVHYGGITNVDFSGLNFGNVPLVKHLLGLLGIWYNDVSRTDILLSLQQVEGANFIKKAMELLPDDRKQEFMNYINTNINELAQKKYKAFGATTGLGGNLDQINPYSTDSILKISYIAPDRDIIDPLAFESGAAIEEGMHLGYEMAKNPISLTNNH